MFFVAVLNVTMWGPLAMRFWSKSSQNDQNVSKITKILKMLNAKIRKDRWKLEKISLNRFWGMLRTRPDLDVDANRKHMPTL